MLRHFVAVTHPSNSVPFVGGMPGDLMAALLLGWSARLPGRLRDAVLHAVAALQGVLAVTAAAAGPAARASERSAEVGCKGNVWQPCKGVLPKGARQGLER